MCKNKFILLSIFLFSAAFVASAASPKNINFPVAELNNCASESACKSYCDKPENIIACVAFGEKNGLMTSEEAAQAREFADVLKGEGPGGCTTKDACENYCDDINNINECLSFAEEHNLIPASELKEAKQVQKALKAGAKLPGGCTNKKSCDEYCGDPNNIEQCLAFAEQAGFISPEEAEHAKKALPLIKAGKSPGGCTTKEKCESYCAIEDNILECVAFAEEAGFIGKEEAEMVRKTGGKGPGDCRGREECEAYCNDSANQETCFKFAEEHDLIPPEKLEEMRTGMARLKEGLEQAPEEVISCLEDQLGENIIEEIKAGTMAPGPAIGEKIKDCFAPMMKEGMKQFREGLSQMPPEMRACIEEKLGAETIAKIEAGEDVEIGPEMGEVMQKCGEAMQEIMQEKMMEGGMIPPEGYVPPAVGEGMMPTEGMMTPLPEGMTAPLEMMGTIPPEMMGEICEKFTLAPSCDYVPEEVRDLCRQCKQ